MAKARSSGGSRKKKPSRASAKIVQSKPKAAAKKKIAPKLSVKKKPAAKRASKAAKPVRVLEARPVRKRERAAPKTLPQGKKPVRTAVELDWGDGGGEGSDEVVRRWVDRGVELLRTLSEHGCGGHEYRADLKEGRFVWLAPSGDVSAEARAQLLCSWSPTTSALTMGWVDPLVRAAAIPRLDGMPPERDDVSEESAWRIAMHAAEASRAAFLYRVPTPHTWYFLALRDLTFSPTQASFTPATPVGLVLRGLGETRHAVASRAEPADVVRERLLAMGAALLDQAGYAYRDTDWVARLERTGKRLALLGKRVARPSYGSVAAGRSASEWVDPEVARDLVKALALLEDEWSAFA